jgi:hypothetical protein
MQTELLALRVCVPNSFARRAPGSNYKSKSGNLETNRASNELVSEHGFSRAASVDFSPCGLYVAS